MIGRLLCKLGYHNTFLQHDRWGLAYVCKRCDFVSAEARW